MGGVAGDDQHERFDDGYTVFAGVSDQFHLGDFVQADAVFQLDAFNVFGVVVSGIEAALGDNGRFFYKTVCHCPRQGVIHHHVFERYGATAGFHKRGGGEFQTKQRLEFVDGTYPSTGTVAVRFIHQQYEVGQRCQIVEIAVAQHFFHALDAWFFAAAHFRIDLGNVENIDGDGGQQTALHLRSAVVVVFTRNDFWWLKDKLVNPPKNVFGRIRGEIGNQLVVNRQVRRKHKEVVDAVSLMQIGDERAH